MFTAKERRKIAAMKHIYSILDDIAKSPKFELLDETSLYRSVMMDNRARGIVTDKMVAAVIADLKK